MCYRIVLWTMLLCCICCTALHAELWRPVVELPDSIIAMTSGHIDGTLYTWLITPTEVWRSNELTSWERMESYPAGTAAIVVGADERTVYRLYTAGTRSDGVYVSRDRELTWELVDWLNGGIDMIRRDVSDSFLIRCRDQVYTFPGLEPHSDGLDSPVLTSLRWNPEMYGTFTGTTSTGVYYESVPGPPYWNAWSSEFFPTDPRVRTLTCLFGWSTMIWESYFFVGASDGLITGYQGEVMVRWQIDTTIGRVNDLALFPAGLYERGLLVATSDGVWRIDTVRAGVLDLVPMREGLRTPWVSHVDTAMGKLLCVAGNVLYEWADWAGPTATILYPQPHEYVSCGGIALLINSPSGISWSSLDIGFDWGIYTIESSEISHRGDTLFLDVPSLPDGEHVVTWVHLQDTLANPLPDSLAWSFFLDTTPPEIDLSVPRDTLIGNDTICFTFRDELAGLSRNATSPVLSDPATSFHFGEGAPLVWWTDSTVCYRRVAYPPTWTELSLSLTVQDSVTGPCPTNRTDTSFTWPIAGTGVASYSTQATRPRLVGEQPVRERIRVEGLRAGTGVVLWDVMGHNVRNATARGTEWECPVNDLPNGVYWIRCGHWLGRVVTLGK